MNQTNKHTKNNEMRKTEQTFKVLQFGYFQNVRKFNARYIFFFSVTK